MANDICKCVRDEKERMSESVTVRVRTIVHAHRSPLIRLYFQCAIFVSLIALFQRGFWRMDCLRAHMFG